MNPNFSDVFVNSSQTATGGAKKKGVFWMFFLHPLPPLPLAYTHIRVRVIYGLLLIELADYCGLYLAGAHKFGGGGGRNPLADHQSLTDSKWQPVFRRTA